MRKLLARPNLIFFVSSTTFVSGSTRPGWHTIGNTIDLTQHSPPRGLQPCDFSAHAGQVHSYANKHACVLAAANGHAHHNNMNKTQSFQPTSKRTT
jgi:hypothetical protein